MRYGIIMPVHTSTTLNIHNPHNSKTIHNLHDQTVEKHVTYAPANHLSSTIVSKSRRKLEYETVTRSHSLHAPTVKIHARTYFLQSLNTNCNNRLAKLMFTEIVIVQD